MPADRTSDGLIDQSKRIRRILAFEHIEMRERIRLTRPIAIIATVGGGILLVAALHATGLSWTTLLSLNTLKVLALGIPAGGALLLIGVWLFALGWSHAPVPDE
jgi:hypothetical protein